VKRERIRNVARFIVLGMQSSSCRSLTFSLLPPFVGLTHIVLDVSGSSGLDLTTMLSLQYIVTEAKKLQVGSVSRFLSSFCAFFSASYSSASHTSCISNARTRIAVVSIPLEY